MSQRRIVLGAVGLAIVLGFGLRDARAIPPFMKEFQAKYAKPDSTDEKEQEYAVLLIENVKCNVCHLQGKPKKDAQCLRPGTFKAAEEGQLQVRPAQG